MNPGDLIDIWVVEKQLGSGGMGSVYRCHNRTATRILAAVKTLDSALRKMAGAEERFIREAEILFRLEHPNIVKVRNVRTDTDPPYLEMEFVEGHSLEGMLDAGPIEIAQAIEFGTQLADAVGYLHEQGIRHRDIKPANVVVRADGRLKLVDFGLAMEADLTRITQTGMTFGTVSYAPPEWAYPDTIDPVRWDIYAMGVLIWEMLTGKVAFPVSGQGSARQQAMQVILQKQNHPPLDPGPAFHDDLRALVRDMTESVAEKRAGDANVLAQRLRKLDRTLARPVAGATIIADEPVLAGGVSRVDTGERSTWNPEQRSTPAPAPSSGGGLQVAASPESAVRKPLTSEPTLSPARRTTGHSHGDEEASTSTRRAAVPIALGLVALGVVGLAGVIAAVAVGFALYGGSGPSPRDVDVIVSGLPAGMPVAIEVGGVSSTAGDGGVYHFAELPAGEAAVVAVIGEGCQPCLDAGECPVWCGKQPSTLMVEAGSDLLTVPLALEPPAPRLLRVTAPKWPEAVIALTVGGKPAIELIPGKYTAEAAAGEARWTGDLIVPWGAGEHVVEVPLEAPAAAAKVDTAPPKGEAKVKEPKPVKQPVVAAVVEAAAAGGAAGKIVTNGAYAKWLASNPDWHRDAAIAAGTADASYLSGWSGATPPAGDESKPMTSTSWYGAAAYCSGRGGLPTIEAAPTTWAESGSAPGLEWRTLDGKKAVWFASDGSSGTAQKSQVTSFTGFRCAK